MLAFFKYSASPLVHVTTKSPASSVRMRASQSSQSPSSLSGSTGMSTPTPSDASRTPRKDHRKSRGGCSRCKARRVKCDEQRPCRNCMRRNESCDLLLTDSARAKLRCPSCVGQDSPMEWGRDAYLMHHYSTETSLSLTPLAAAKRLFQLQMPEYALREPYLMRGLMSLSAFHLAYKRPAEAAIWMPLAFKHQNSVLRSLRLILSSINEANCRALFCLSSILGFTALSSSTWSHSVAPDGIPELNEVIQPLILFRGTSDLGKYAQQLADLFEGPGGPLAGLLEGYHITSDTKEYLPASAALQFTKLQELIVQKHLHDSVYQEQFIGTIVWLEKIYSEIGYTKGTANGNMAMVWKWIGHVNESYMAYLKALDPVALVIFAHFALLSKVLKSYWYIQGWPEAVIKSITHSVKDPVWRESLVWVEQQLDADLDIFEREDTKVSVQVH